MLVRPHSMLQEARRSHFALGAFNTSNLEVTQAIIWAAQATKAPVIVQTSEGALAYAGLAVLTGIIKMLAAEASVPVVLHLDHGKSLRTVVECVEAGYTSVMIDASDKPMEQNVAVTKEVVQYAHDRGVWVEAELGAILGQEGGIKLEGKKTPSVLLTDPVQAEKFVARTGVDALAVSVGTIHGAFTGQEYIRFELLEEIAKRLPNMPLVVHGASGIADEHIRTAVKRNVSKVNVDTELRLAFERAVASYLEQPRTLIDPRQMLAGARGAVQEVVGEKIRLLGSAGRAQ